MPNKQQRAAPVRTIGKPQLEGREIRKGVSIQVRDNVKIREKARMQGKLSEVTDSVRERLEREYKAAHK